MPSKNHKHSMSQPERGFWREAFLRCWPAKCDKNGNPIHLADEIKARADFADAAVAEYRQRITWRSNP